MASDVADVEGTARLKCYVHCQDDETETILPFSRRRWETFLVCGNQWLELDGEQRLVAERRRHLFDTDPHSTLTTAADIPVDAGYHTLCYSRFTDKGRIERAIKRKTQGTQNIIACPPGQDSDLSEVNVAEPSPKRLRSTTTTTLSSTRSVLPKVCIICKKATKYITSGHKRVQDRLIQAETEEGGKLLEAATLKCDESVLLHIRGKDCAAIEVKYHNVCYKNYTRCVHSGTDTTYTESERAQLYKMSYEIFCNTVIQERIIKRQEIFRMSSLVQRFVALVKQHEDADISDYRSDLLKYHLKRDFPQLQFFSPYRRNTSELVFTESLSAVTIVDQIPTSSETETETEKEGSTSEKEDVSTPPQYFQASVERTRSLFTTGVIVKTAIKEMSSSTLPWPPTSATFDKNSVLDVIPIELYNLLAWCVGFSDQPTLTNFVQLSEEEDTKLLSIAQDIVYLASKGRKQTPKSLCLGLTVRHLTGSSQLLNILNRFGHTASWNTILNYETALAQLQLSTQDQIPQGFQEKKATVLVWDNIDFGEETLSGKGTTHHTNGIMVQGKIDTEVQSKPESVIVKKGRSQFKPTVQAITPFSLLKRQGPQTLSGDLIMDKDFYAVTLCRPQRLDFSYILIKNFDTTDSVPGWTGFNTELQRDEILEKSAIKYLPVIEASPTELSTVNEILKQSIQKADTMGLETITLVFDQAIYAKAQQIRWKDDMLMHRTVIRLGEFHTCASFCGVIGKRFRDAGLEDILIESEVVAQGSIETVLNGHHYNRSVRAHKLLYEALQLLRFQQFLNSLPDPERDIYKSIASKLWLEYPSEQFQDVLYSDEFGEAMSKYHQFVTERSSEDATFAFWSSYIDVVQLLINFIRATRESDWELHLSSIQMMMPWFFSYDRMNYSRYLPAYWLEMVNLKQTHPECYDELSVKGQWTVQRQGSHPFSSIACDQAIEQTCNRDSKTGGGITGITLNRAAVQRWILAQPERAAITRTCEEMAGVSTDTRPRKDLDKTRISRDNADVKALLCTIETMINPFNNMREGLVSISSGAVATEDVKMDLLKAEEKGEEALEAYIQTRLIKKDKDIFEPIKNLKLKTFSDLKKQKATTTKSGKEVTMKNDRKFFARLLVLGQTRELNLRDVLSHSLGTVSHPLSNADGSLAKTNKAALLHLLESKADFQVDSAPENNALIIDGMALLQALGNVPQTFGELADVILTQVMGQAKKFKSRRIDFVTDRYPLVSIKNAERSRRAAAGFQTIQIYSPSQKTPSQWKKFLSSGENKESLVKFLFSAWKEANFESVDTDVDIYIAHAEDCHVIQINSGKGTLCEVKELGCDHEEADTRLLLHAKHASLDYSTIIIRSPDTDVAIIAISLLHKFTPGIKMYFLTGVKNKTRMIDLSQLSTVWGSEVCKALIGIHSFTGCDSTSAFYGKGKKKAFNLACSSDDFINAFCELGNDFELSPQTAVTLECFVCQLYGQPPPDINEARYRMFCVLSSGERSLPPTHDALGQHCKRANFQAAVHKRSLRQTMGAPSPEGYGWTLKDNELNIVWMTKSPAPESILEAVHCSCKVGNCSSGRCSCSTAKLSCTDLCKCNNCQNISQTSEEVIFDNQTAEDGSSDTDDV